MHYSQSRLVRQAAARMAVGAVVAGGLLMVAVPGAQAGNTTVTFNTPGATTWTVPEGVTSLQVAAYGGQGGSLDATFTGYGSGGFGARVRASLPVTPGQHVSLLVAGAGTGTHGGTGGGAPGGAGDYPGLGGGGASSVSLGEVTWLVAGGGGGAAPDRVNGGRSAGLGKTRGRIQDGGGGSGATSTTTGALGGAGGSSAGLEGCATDALGGPSGAASSADNGGDGGGREDDQAITTGGGGGGGGYVGGGGGGGGAYCLADSSGDNRYGDGGGGGGGSSYVRDTATNAQIVNGRRSGDGMISITYDDPTSPSDHPVLSPAPNAAGWNHTPVNVAWHWTDIGTGVDPTHCIQHSTTGNRVGVLSLEASCSDLTGNTSIDQIQVKVDTTRPKAAPTRTDRHRVRGWTRGAAVIKWNWTDTVSGIDTAACPHTRIQGKGGVRQVRATCTDVAGNTTTASVIVKIDRTAPRIIAKRLQHRVYHRGQYVKAKYRCKDAGVGVKKCHGSVKKGHRLHTKKLGRHILKIKATDKLGNTRIKKIVYRVIR